MSEQVDRLKKNIEAVKRIIKGAKVKPLPTPPPPKK